MGRKLNQRLRASTKLELSMVYKTVALAGAIGTVVFLYTQFGNNDDARADNGTVTTIGSGHWDDPNIWPGQSVPGDETLAVMVREQDRVTITKTVKFNGTLSVYGTLVFANGKLRMDKSSKIVLAQGGAFRTEAHTKKNMLKIGDKQWKGNQINLIGTPNTLCGNMACDQSATVALSFFRLNIIKSGKAILLEWQPEQASPTGYFTVEKSYDGTDFASIGAVQGTELGEGGQYQYEDKFTKHGEAFYRLKHTSPQGQHAYFNAMSISLKQPKPKYKIDLDYPNPFTGYYSAIGEAPQLPGEVPGAGDYRPKRATDFWPGNHAPTASIGGKPAPGDRQTQRN